jgi:hypothetical protein
MHTMRKRRSRALAPIFAGALLILGGCENSSPSLTTAASSPGPGLSATAVYVATAGVDTPGFIRVTNAEASPAIRIGPERGAGYGLGEATLVFRKATPDGERALIVLQTRDQKQFLYALAADGSTADAPVRVAAADALDVDLEISPDGSQVLYVDRGMLYRARLSGEDASAPVLLATPPLDRQIRRPRWVLAGERAVFEIERQAGDGQIAATIHSARLDGSEAMAPVALTMSSFGQDRAQGVLPDGRVIAMLEAGVLWAIPADGGKAVRLGPTGLYSPLIAVIDGGARLVVSLAQGANWPRRLAVLATDGSLADNPLYLSDVVEDLQTIVSPDGKTVAYVGQVAGSWAVFEVPATGASPPERVTAWLSSRPYLSTFTSNGAAMLACSNADRTILRIDRPGSTSNVPVVIETGPPSQPGCPPQMVLTTDETQVLFNGHDSDGSWSSFQVPLKGGAPTLLVKGGAGQPLPSGVVFFDLGHQTSAIFARLPSGDPRILTPWHPTAIRSARLAGDTVVYRAEATWYAVASDGRDSEAPRRITPKGVDGEVLAITDDRLTLRSGSEPTELYSFALDGANADAPVVLAQAPKAWTLADSLGLLLYSKESSVFAVSTKGSGGAAVEVMKAVPGAYALAFDAPNALALAVVGEQILAAPVDGSMSGSPIVVSSPGAELFAFNVAQKRGRALITLATTDTAVPHPIAVLTARTGGQDAAAKAPLAPPGYLLLNTPDYGAPALSEPVFISDGESALLWGPEGLYSARVDGSEAAAPRSLFAGDSVELLPSLPIAPDGQGWVVKSGSLHYVMFDGLSPSRELTPPLTQPVTKALWADGGTAIVFLTEGRLHIARIAGTEAHALTPLTSKSVEVGELVGLDPLGTGVIFQRASGPDRSLMVVPANGSETTPSSLTPIDDAAEELVGFVGSSCSAAPSCGL